MPENLKALEGLLERVLEANGPNYALELDIWQKLTDGKFPPPFMASLDSALALTEGALPSGCSADILLADAVNWMTETGWRPAHPLAPQVSRALIVQLLKAKIAGARDGR